MFAFPNPVNEKAARVVAGVVALVAITTLATGWYWLLVPLAYGFVARAGAEPRLLQAVLQCYQFLLNLDLQAREFQT